MFNSDSNSDPETLGSFHIKATIAISKRSLLDVSGVRIGIAGVRPRCQSGPVNELARKW